MTGFITSLATTVIVYVFVTRGALVVARILNALARKFSDNSSKKPPRGGQASASPKHESRARIAAGSLADHIVFGRRVTWHLCDSAR